MTSPPTRSRWLDMTPSSCNPERNLVTSLHLKLNQLSLTTMSKQARPDDLPTPRLRTWASRPALETLADLELDSRNGRAIERRFRCPACMPSTPSTAFHFQAPQEPHESRRTASCACSIWSSSTKAPASCSSAIPAWARHSWPRSSAGAPARPISASCSPPPWTCSII